MNPITLNSLFNSYYICSVIVNVIMKYISKFNKLKAKNNEVILLTLGYIRPLFTPHYTKKSTDLPRPTPSDLYPPTYILRPIPSDLYPLTYTLNLSLLYHPVLYSHPTHSLIISATSPPTLLFPRPASGSRTESPR